MLRSETSERILMYSARFSLINNPHPDDSLNPFTLRIFFNFKLYSRYFFNLHFLGVKRVNGKGWRKKIEDVNCARSDWEEGEEQNCEGQKKDEKNLKFPFGMRVALQNIDFLIDCRMNQLKTLKCWRMLLLAVEVDGLVECCCHSWNSLFSFSGKVSISNLRN
jgi:hypothetical protein